MSVRVIQGDCRAVLTTLPANSVHCVVTSPPYWGLRDYGIAPTVWGGDAACEHVWGDERITPVGNAPSLKSALTTNNGRGPLPGDKFHADNAGIASQGAFCHCGAWRGAHGLEPTIDLYVRNAVEIFRAVHRVLRPDGTLWLNLGDSYSTSPAGNKTPSGISQTIPKKLKSELSAFNTQPKDFTGLKPKDLCGIPWRIAFALQADGWWLRQDIIWAKPNPMPESVTDRCTKAHEYLFLLTKSARYFWDAEAIREEQSPGTLERFGNGKAQRLSGKAYHKERHEALSEELLAGRNKRSVWTVATSPFPEAHFATFPPELIEPCIKAGTSEKGCCAKCGVPWERQNSEKPTQGSWNDHENDLAEGSGARTGRRRKQQYLEALKYPKQTLGWQPTCKCAAAVVPATVLDCFGGAGTTGLVADRLQRNAILIELNPTYAEMARRRITSDAPLFALAAE